MKKAVIFDLDGTLSDSIMSMKYSGDKTMAQAAAASRDTAGTRAFALVLLALSAAGVYAVVRWGGAASFG